MKILTTIQRIFYTIWNKRKNPTLLSRRQYQFAYGLLEGRKISIVLLAFFFVFFSLSHSLYAAFNSPIFISTFGTAGAGNGQFNRPIGITVHDSTGNIYVTDFGNNRVQIFDTLGNFISTFGSAGAGDGQFNGPYDVDVLTSTGNVYVTDENHARVQVFDSTNAFVNKFTLAAASRPTGIFARNSTNLIYVSDSGGLQEVRVFDPNGNPQFNFRDAANPFNNPQGIVSQSSPNGDVYVVDQGNQDVQVWTTSPPTFVTTFGTGSFTSPIGIDLQSDTNHIYVVDNGDALGNNSKVVVFDGTSNPPTFLGSFGTAGIGNAQFKSPSFINVQATTGKIYITDTANNRVQEWFSPVEWTQPGTSQLAQLPLAESLSLLAGQHLEVVGETTISNSILTVNPDTTFTTGNLVLNEATLADNANTTFSFPISIATQGTLADGPGNISTYSGQISGNTLTIGGPGKVILTNPLNSYSGTLINGGTLAVPTDAQLGGVETFITFNGGLGSATLQFLAGGFLSPRAIDILTSQATIDTNGFNAELDGVITGELGSLGLKKVGGGTLTLTGANSYIGTTEIDGGTVAVNSDGNLGDPSAGVVLNNGALQINSPGFVSDRTFSLRLGGGTINTNGKTATISGLIQDGAGAGLFTVTGGGELILTRAAGNTYTGGTLVTKVTALGVSQDNQLGAVLGRVTFDNGGLQFLNTFTSARGFTLNAGGGAFDTHGNSPTLKGVIGGIGDLQVFDTVGGGNLTLSGANTYSGTTTITGGTLTFAGDTSGLGGDIADNAALVFNQTADSSFRGAVSGPGTLTKKGPNNLTMKGDFSGFTGQATISQGQMTVTTSAPNKINLQNPGVIFDFQPATAATLAYKGNITGNGKVRIDGAGTTSFASTGSYTYSGATTVNQGVFVLNGGLAKSDVKVESGARIRGTGSMRSLDLAGTIAPGNSIGTLTVNNDYTMQSTATYDAEIAANGKSDLIAVGKKATLTGTLNVISADTFTALAGQNFTILTAHPVSGTFATQASTNQIPYSVTYNPTSVVINIPTVESVVTTPPGDRVVYSSGTTVQTIVGQQIITTIQNSPISDTGGSCVAPAFQASFDKLVERQRSFAMNSQELMHSGSRRRNLVETPEVQSRIIPLSQRVTIGKTNVWFQNYDQVAWLKGTSHVPGAKSKTFGGMMGADYEILKNTFFGLFAGASNSPFHLKSTPANGSVKSYYGGFYATRLSEMGFYVDGQLFAGGNRFHTKRKIDVGAFHAKAKSDHKGYQLFTKIEAGQVLPLPAVVFMPFINVGYALIHEEGSREKGAGNLDFVTKHRNDQFMRGEVGTRIYRTYLVDEALVRPEFDISYIYAHTVGPHRSKGHFVNNPQSVILPSGRRGFNQVAPSFSLTGQFKSGLYLIGTVRGELGSALKTLSGFATIGYNF